MNEDGVGSPIYRMNEIDNCFLVNGRSTLECPRVKISF